MEKVFKSKGWKTWEQVLMVVCVILCAVAVWYTKNYFLIISFTFPLLIGYNQFFLKYVVKENGELWVSGMCGISLNKSVGIYRVLYYPKTKGWNNRNRRMVIFYKSGLRQGSFPINPADPEGLMAVLKERNPGLNIERFSI